MALVSCFCGSEPALRDLGVADGPARWLESLARLRPELELEPPGAVLSRWDDDPWAGAAYSVSPPPQLVEALQRPLGPLAFAGEHLGGRYHGLMEGALRSGREAAESLLSRGPRGGDVSGLLPMCRWARARRRHQRALDPGGDPGRRRSACRNV